MANYVFKNISAFNINDSIIKVSTLPTESINPNAIYMIFNSETGDKTYHQYRNNTWVELIDSSDCNSDYYYVPNEDYIENVYLNTTIPIDEVDDLINTKLSFTESSLISTLLWTQSSAIIVKKISGISGYAIIYTYNYFSVFDYLYVSNQNVANEVGVDFVGWKKENEIIIKVQDTALSEHDDNDFANIYGKIGENNQSISNLFSIRPFEESGLPLVVDELPQEGKNDGSIYNLKEKINDGTITVPNTGKVGTIYFNTSEDILDIINILDSLTYITTPLFAYPICPILFASDGVPVIFVSKYIGQYSTPSYEITIVTDMANQVFEYAFTYNVAGVTSGFQKNEYVVEKDVISEYSGLPIGSQNVLLAPIISVEPFEKNTYHLYENKQFVELNTSSGGSTPIGTLEITENGAHDVTNYAIANVNVPVPNGYIIPTGTLEVTENGTHNVKEYESVVVNVESTGTGKDMLQARVDAINSCHYLFYNYTGNNVDFIANLDTSNVTNMEKMFYGCEKLTTIPQLDTSNVTDMNSMFTNCKRLTTIPQLDTSNATNMNSIFFNCKKLTTIPQLNTSNVTSMSYMFTNCEKLTTIPQLDTSNVTDMSYMFKGCGKLTTIPQLNTSNVTNMYYIFGSCNALKSIDISHYNISNSSNCSNFAKDCWVLNSLIIRSFGANYVLNSNSFTKNGIENGTGYIYVPRDMVDTLKSATNWSTYADQIRALEDYTVDGTTTGDLDETKI